MKNTYLFVFEGLDGCGKSTQLELFKNYLNKNHPEFKIVHIREPGGTDLGEKVRNLLLDKNNINPKTELLLFLAARNQLVEEIIKPIFNSLEKTIILCDRFIYSTIAYQGYGRGLNINLMDTIHKFILDDIRPDLCWFIDTDLRIINERNKTKEKDRIENENKTFFEKVKIGYMDMVERNMLFEINGNDEVNIIHNQILSDFKYLLNIGD